MSEIDAGAIADGVASGGPGKAIALIASAFIPIPGIGLAIAAAMALANRGKDQDMANAVTMRNAMLRNNLQPLAQAVSARDYDLAMQFFPLPTSDLSQYYWVSLDYAPAAANAWYAAVLGYALEHNDISYLVRLARTVDAVDRQELFNAANANSDGGGE